MGLPSYLKLDLLKNYLSNDNLTNLHYTVNNSIHVCFLEQTACVE